MLLMPLPSLVGACRRCDCLFYYRLAPQFDLDRPRVARVMMSDESRAFASCLWCCAWVWVQSWEGEDR